MRAILLFLGTLAIVGLFLEHVTCQDQPTFGPQFDGRQMNQDGLASVLINMTGNNLPWLQGHPLNLMGFGHKGRQIREDPRMKDDGIIPHWNAKKIIESDLQILIQTDAQSLNDSRIKEPKA